MTGPGDVATNAVMAGVVLILLSAAVVMTVLIWIF